MVLLLAAPATATPWRAHVRQAGEYAQQRAGKVSFGVRTERGLRGVAVRRTVPSASVVKAMLLVAYLRQPGVRSRRLRPDERALLRPMIRRSDKARASQRVQHRGHLRARPAHGARADAPLPRHPAVGPVVHRRADQTRFFLRIDRYEPRCHRRFAMRLVVSIVTSQRWGIARVRPCGWALYFKGGWGSGSGWADRQVALLRRGRRRTRFTAPVRRVRRRQEVTVNG